MNQLNVAVLFGGCSSEYGVSLESAFCVIDGMDKEKFNPVLIGISEKGDWFLFEGDTIKIKNNTWWDPSECTPAAFSPNRDAKKLSVFRFGRTEDILIDAVFPVLHGKNGEDGTVQGMTVLSGIPLAGCGVLSSALCMDKDRAHRIACTAGVSVPKSVVLKNREDIAKNSSDIRQLGFPLFVKPVKAGSSLGITRVETMDALYVAVLLAFQYDDRVILEEAIDGFEVGCALLGNTELTVGEVDEIEISGAFFDFSEKYTRKTSTIHVPARISKGKTEEIKETAKRLYDALDCRGFARVDLFLTPSGKIIFNEINTIPGFTPHSRYPNMMKAAGLSFQSLITCIIELAVME